MVTVVSDPYVVFGGLIQEDDFALQSVLSCVGDHMARDVVSLTADQPVSDAVDLFARHEFRHLPVTDGPHLGGMLSDREALRALLRDPEAATWPVSAIMARNPATIRPHASISEAIHLLLSHRVNCLPVTAADGSILGILSASDLMRGVFCLQRWLETRAPRLQV